MVLPYEEGDDLDFIVLGVTPSPGRCVITGHDRFKEWDIQKAKGQTGASSQLQGDPIGAFTVTFFLAEDDSTSADNDFTRWDEFERLIKSMTSGPRPTAMPIYHPDLARQGFTEVSSGGIGGRVHDGRGGVSIAVKFVEYKPPKPKGPAQAQAKPGANPPGRPPKPDPNAAAKAELTALVAEARKP